MPYKSAVKVYNRFDTRYLNNYKLMDGIEMFVEFLCDESNCEDFGFLVVISVVHPPQYHANQTKHSTGKS
jgi:hypothetical protein